MDGLGLFCQPHGWRLNPVQQAPSFFTSVLTDIKASNHYCAVLSFFEEAPLQPSKHAHDEELYMEGIDDYDEPHIDLSNGAIQCTMYAPKCLVLVSQHFYLKTLKVSHDDNWFFYFSSSYIEAILSLPLLNHLTYFIIISLEIFTCSHTDLVAFFFLSLPRHYSNHHNYLAKFT